MKLNALLSIVSTFLCWLTFSASCYAQPQSDGYVHDVIQLEDIPFDDYNQNGKTRVEHGLLTSIVSTMDITVQVNSTYKTGWNRTYITRCEDQTSGFATTSSKGIAKKLKITWHTNANKASQITVYGKDEPYTSITDVENEATKGTPLGSIDGTQTEITLGDAKKYIAIVLANNIYTCFTSLDIAWQQTDYERSVTSGSLNTLCLPYDAKEIPDGMHVFEVLGKTMDGALPSSIDFTPVDRIEAGIPYVFVNDYDNLHLELQGDEALSTASNRKGLYGTFVKYPFADDGGYNSNYYIINSSNEVQAASSSSGVVANRAFIKMNEVPDLATVQSLPSRRLVLTANGFSIVDGTTSIANATTMTTESNTTYDLSGRMLREIPSSAKGLYIVNGKKVIK